MSSRDRGGREGGAGSKKDQQAAVGKFSKFEQQESEARTGRCNSQIVQ